MVSALLEPSAVLNTQAVGWYETIILGMTGGNWDMGSTFVKDAWTGKKLGALYPGAMTPELEWTGLKELVVGGANEVTAAVQGLYRNLPESFHKYRTD